MRQIETQIQMVVVGNGTKRGLHAAVALAASVVLSVIAVGFGQGPGAVPSLRTQPTLGHGPVVESQLQAAPVPTASLDDPQPPTEPVALGDRGAAAMRFVYFVEADAEIWPGATDAIERQAVDLQEFWYDQFGGTFALGEQTVTVVFGEHPASWYDTNPNGDEPRWYRLRNIQEEVWSKLGVTSETRMVVYPATRIDGRVGAVRYSGAWMDGDDLTCIDGIVATVPYATDFPANCLMTVAHELGHVYGLGHQGDSPFCMQLGFYQYVNGEEPCDFSPLSRRLVTSDERNAPWLDAVPGERRG